MAGSALAAFLGALIGVSLAAPTRQVVITREGVREARAEEILVPVPRNGRLSLAGLQELQRITEEAAREILDAIRGTSISLERAIRETAFKLETKAYELYKPTQIRSAMTVNPDESNWVDLRRKRPQAPLIIWVTNSHDQSLGIQVVGNIAKTTSDMVPIGAGQTVDANGGVLSIFIDDSYWHPYISLSITASIQPSTGAVRAVAFWQE